MICKKDCFNCQYEDCINDRIDYEDVEASVERDRDAKPKRKPRTPEQIERSRIKQRKYYHEHPEQEKARRKKWAQENRERDNAYQRAHYAAHKDEILAKGREKRRSVKGERTQRIPG